MKRVVAFLLGCTVIVTAAGAMQEPQRVWPGLARKHCGAEVTLVDTRQDVTVFHPPSEYFGQFRSETLFQGEFDREAVPLRQIIAAANAQSVRMVDCDAKVRVIGKADADNWYVVLAGKGVLKLVSVRQGNPPVTHLRFVRLLDFSGPMITDAP